MGLSEDGGCDCGGCGCAECMDSDGCYYRRGRRVSGSYHSDEEGSWSDLPCDDYSSLQYLERQPPVMAPKKCNYVAKPDPAKEPNLMKLADISFVCEATGENTIRDLAKRIAPYGFFESERGISPCLGDRYVLCSSVGESNRLERIEIEIESVVRWIFPEDAFPAVLILLESLLVHAFSAFFSNVLAHCSILFLRGIV